MGGVFLPAMEHDVISINRTLIFLAHNSVDKIPIEIETTHIVILTLGGCSSLDASSVVLTTGTPPAGSMGWSDREAYLRNHNKD